jgi:hypothetical protein
MTASARRRQRFARHSAAIDRARAQLEAATDDETRAAWRRVLDEAVTDVTPELEAREPLPILRAMLPEAKR